MVSYGDLFLEGVEDLHGDEYKYKEEKIEDIKAVFKSFGYTQVVTPSFEYYDLYTRIEGSIDREKMFKLVDETGKILVLRPDATIPVARMAVTNYKDSKEYLKFSYVTNIFRLDKVRNGNKREFIQAGVEYLGNSKPDCDAEIIAIGIKTLIESGFTKFHIDLGQVLFLNSLIQELNIDYLEREKLHRLIENKNYGDLEEYLDAMELNIKLKEAIKAIPRLYGKPEKILTKAKEICINKDMEKALSNLEEIYSILKDYGYDKYILFDLGFAKELNYYTGIVFKGYVNNYGEVMLSGGRYDDLTKQFGMYKPACGFGLNVDKLVEVMKINDMAYENESYVDYLILYKRDNRKNAIELSEDLRKKGYIVETDLYNDDISECLEAQNSINAREVLEINNDEIKSIDLQRDKIHKYSFNEFKKLIEKR